MQLAPDLSRGAEDDVKLQPYRLSFVRCLTSLTDTKRRQRPINSSRLRYVPSRDLNDADRREMHGPANVGVRQSFYDPMRQGADSCPAIGLISRFTSCQKTISLQKFYLSPLTTVFFVCG